MKFKRTMIAGILLTVLGVTAAHAQTNRLQTKYAVVTIDNKGYIISIKSRKTGNEYCPKGLYSPLVSLEKDRQTVLPVKAVFNAARESLSVVFGNGSEANIKIDQKAEYLRMQLLSLNPRNGVDNVVWGPYKTNISKTIGDVIGVVRDDEFAIGLLGLDDNTTSGPPTEGDMSFMYYFIHSPDPKKFPLPSHLKEGQTFSIGGDGVNDVAFYSQPEEYFRMNYGNGAVLEPAYGSSICMHARDRRKEQMILFPYYPPGLDGKANSSRHQLVTATHADFIGSSVAFYACPDSLGLKTIEKIVLNEGLPHPTIDGKWIKDPAAYRPDVAWWGAHDSLASYVQQLHITGGVQDEGWGEYYPDPANRWTKKGIHFNGSATMTIPQYGAQLQKKGIRYGLHTLCEFLQPGSSHVSPVPSDSLIIMQRTVLTKDLSETDTIITVADTAYFNEFGGWEGNHTNVLKIGKELIEYDGITRSWPYTFLHVKRGFHGTQRGSYQAGTTIVKLQPNCYRGFAPDMDLQEYYADYYGKWLAEGGMDYIDFDGLESCIYQGHGQYSFKRFFRGLFDSYHRSGGKYLRVMGSAVGEGSWHYMSVVNVGGGDHMFSPVLNKWGIEGKDIRYVWESSYFPATFGIQSYQADWSLYDAENLQAKSIGWNATYMLGLSQQTVEASAGKEAIFKAFRTWEKARAANVFTKAHKEVLKDLRYKYHLEQAGAAYLLYPVKENRFRELAYSTAGHTLVVENEFESQALDLSVKIVGPKEAAVDGLVLSWGTGQEIVINKRLSGGQYVILREGKLYTADRGRKVLEYIPVTGRFTIPTGKTNLVIKGLQAAHDKIALEVVVPVIGEAIRIGSTKVSR